LLLVAWRIACKYTQLVKLQLELEPYELEYDYVIHMPGGPFSEKKLPQLGGNNTYEMYVLPKMLEIQKKYTG
jgi:hypothetical protein